MPTYSSPGTYVIEKDFSDYPTAVNSSIAGIVGFASKGPANKATLVTSAAQLIRTFGEPDATEGGQGLLGALEILEKTNSIYYVRAEDETTAKGANGYLKWGVCPAAKFSVEGAASGVQVELLVSSLGNDGTASASHQFSYLTGSQTDGYNATKLLNMQGAIETADFPWTMIRNNDNEVFIIGREAGQNSRLQVSATFNGASPNSISVFDYNGTLGSSSDKGEALGYETASSYAGGAYYIQSLYTGKGYNFSQTSTNKGVVNRGISVETVAKTGKWSEVNIYDSGVLSESFTVSFENSGGYFPEDIINVGTLNNTSEHIMASFANSDGTLDSGWTAPELWPDKIITPVGEGLTIVNPVGTDFLDANPRFCKLIETRTATAGISELVGGKNGDFEGSTEIADSVKSALIGLPTYKTGIYALDDDFLNISMACVPGITQENVQNTLISLAEKSQNFLAVVAPPFGFTSPQQAINWHNGQADGRNAAINNSYAAVYWPWLKTFDVHTSTDIYIDPAAFAIGVMCNTDAQADPWFAPAGLTRGRLSKPTDVEVILNQGDRDQLYQPGNAINPIAKFAQDGIVIWGQRTAQRTPSALDRVNIRRMMIAIRKMVLRATRTIVFEPNDALTWDRVVHILGPALDNIKRRRGITEFRVICDETTNTPLRVDRNEMWCRVMIKPTKTAEVLVFELNLTNQSASV